MFEDLKKYLLSVVPSIQVEIIERCYKNLYTIYGEMIPMALSDIVNIVNSNEDSTNIANIYNTTIDHIEESLLKFGVVIDDDEVEFKDLDDLNNILTTFLEIESFDDLESILNIIEISNDSTASLNEIINLVNATEIDYTRYILKVSDEVLPNIKNVVSDYIRNKADEKEMIQVNPKLVKFLQLGYHQKVSEKITMVLLTKPCTLSLDSILRTYGNQLADSATSEYGWVLACLASSEYEAFLENNDFLYNRWGKYFLEETDIISTTARIQKVLEALEGNQ